MANEDSFLVDASLGLYLVADGMGGHAGGAHASAMCADVVNKVVRRGMARLVGMPQQTWNDAIAEILQASASEASARIYDQAQVDRSLHGMGTTLTGILFHGDRGYIVHVGDSRAYLRRGRALTQLTTDHSIVGQLIAAGRLQPEQARSYEHRNVLLQALGVQPRVGPEIIQAQLRAGDVLMVCSDGLTGPLADDQILALMLRYEDPLRCCRALTEAACAAGGPDNVTVAIARFTGEGLELPQGREEIALVRVQHAL